MNGMSGYTSYGICELCGKRTTKAGMTRHLQSCLAEHEPSRGEAARIFRLRIEDAYSPAYWMDVEPLEIPPQPLLVGVFPPPLASAWP